MIASPLSSDVNPELDLETESKCGEGRSAAMKSPYLLVPVLLLCLSFAACSGSASDAKAGRARGNTGQPMPVSVATAKTQDMPVYLTRLGSVSAFNTVSVKTRVDGQLVKVAFKEGQHVNKGDLLAVIDPRPYQVALEQQQATCRSSKWTLSRRRWISWKAPYAPIKPILTMPN